MPYGDDGIAAVDPQHSRTRVGVSPVCLSAEIDVAAGLAVGIIGVDALRHVRRPAERALAAIPVVLAAHLLVEAFVWWGLNGQLPHAVVGPAAWVYLAIAFGVLPVLVPLAVGALEPVSNRRRTVFFVAVGVGVSTMLMYAVVRGPIDATVRGHHIDYRADLWHGGALVALYLLATCGGLLASSHRHVRWFGAANLAAACALAWIDGTSFISLWCFWAAVASISIAVHLRYAEHEQSRLVIA